MSYIIDVYRRTQEPMKDVMEFAAFVTFFPHLIAGPIQRIRQLVPQIVYPDNITYTRVASGLLLFASGMFRKCLGDTLPAFHDPIFEKVAAAQPAEAIFAVFTFGLQIYLDFSGYSEMALGLARMLGIDLVQNFNAPYLATSIRDFWRRWHISLSLWLRDYLYISLGGSRAGLARQIANLLFTMTVCGLWHGAGWNFALWGLLHGLYLACNTILARIMGDWWDRQGKWQTSLTILSVPLTYLASNYAWIYFRLGTLDEALIVNRKIAAWFQAPQLPTVPYGILAAFGIVFLLDLYTRFKGEIFGLSDELTWRRAAACGAVAGLMLVAGIILAVGQPTQQFIYFNF
jgi:D-alanyl-lipoteichoic acid acyltransferase DltB (MBOAT superfamily)